MPTLLSLPVELHLGIIKETDLYDLEALWTSCKTFYAYGKDKLQLHTYRKYKFHTIIVGWDNGSPDQIHPLLDLRDVLEDEEAKLYPRVMEINSLSYGDPDEDDDDSLAERKRVEIHEIVEEHGDRIDTMVAEIHRKLLPNAPPTDATAWSNEIQWGEPAATVVLLLALYPHLESLHIYDPNQDWWSTDYGELFTSVTSAAADSTTNTLGILSKLSDFTLRGCTSQSGLQSKAELLSPFMALPTVRSIEAYDVDGRNVQWSWGTGFSQVTDVKFELCDIDTTTLTSHIGAMKALVTFTYKFHPTTDEDEVEYSRWEPRAIVASLHLYACDTLTILELTASNLKKTEPFQDDEPCLGSLRAFKVLRLVKLDTMMLYERVKPASSLSGKPGQKVSQENRKQARAQPLVEFLPASIQRFHLMSRKVGKGPSRQDVGTMFIGLPNLRTRCLPKLEEICVEYTDEADDVEEEGRLELRSRCKEAGIKVESIKWSGWTSQTSWMA